MPQLRTGPMAPGIAFITGGARGLGNAVAQSFAKDGAAGIVLVDIQDEETFSKGRQAVEVYGTRCLTIRADVTKEDEIEDAVAQAVKEFGRIDYAANFAGIAGPLETSWNIPADEYRKVIEVNSIGVWLSIRAEIKQMLKQDSVKGIEEGRVEQKGSIVSAASALSIQGMGATSGYTASKHAVLGMTKSIALEVRDEGIRVNCVSPGFFLSGMQEPLLRGELHKGDQEGSFDKKNAQKSWAEFEERQGRRPTFDEVGDVVVMLSSPRMSFVVGHNLVIDGGYTINGSNH